MSFSTHEFWKSAFGEFHSWYRVRDHFELINGFPYSSAGFNLEGNGKPVVRIRDLLSDDLPTFYQGDEGQDVVVRDGDIAIGMDGDFNSVTWAKGNALLNQRVCALRVKKTSAIDPRILGYQLPISLKIINDLTPWSTVKHLSALDVLSLRFPLFDLEAQRQIADFLDRETARIDLLIEKKQRFAENLSAKIQDFADLLVTGRDNPQRKMKPVESPWLGEIPDNWEIKKAKYLFNQMDRKPKANDGVITAFRDGQVCLRTRRRTEGFTFAILEVGYQHICAGDLVIHSMDAFAGAIGVSEDCGKATGEYVVCSPKTEEANCEYYAYLLRCMARRDYIFVLCPSVRERAPRFRFVRFAPIQLPVPPREEQDKIVERIASATNGLKLVRDKTLASIDRLKEYRSALITAAVTGKIDVARHSRSAPPGSRLYAPREEMDA